MRITHHTKTNRVARTFVGAAALALTGLGIGACDDESAHPPRNDVDTGWNCAVESGLVRASGTVTNHSSKTSFYVIEVAFSFDGKAAVTRSAAIDGVEPGQTVLVETSAAAAGKDDVRCDVTNVERFRA